MLPPASAEASMDTSSGGDRRQVNASCPPSRQNAKIKSSVKNQNAGKAKKRVSWDRIHTREFKLVVGDHPMCQDSLPVSLGWQYDDCSSKNMNAIQGNQSAGKGENLAPGPSSPQQKQQQQPAIISERRQSYVFPRRLSYEERRERLILVSNLTSDQIKNEEIDLVVRKMKESWEMQYLYSDCSSDDDVILTPIENDDYLFLPLVNDDLMELDDIEVIPGSEDQELGDITNFQWIDN